MACAGAADSDQPFAESFPNSQRICWSAPQVQWTLDRCCSSLHLGMCSACFVLSPQIRTKDRVFDSISHLIGHHLESRLPIVSAGSELCLQQPVERKQ